MFFIDKLSSKPIYEQVIEGIERNILLGIYPAGTQVPSLRELSVSLGVNPNTIQKSYADLTRRGILCPSPGSGCYVSPEAPERIRRSAMTSLEKLEALAASLALSGIEEDLLLEIIHKAYRKNATQKGGNEP